MGHKELRFIINFGFVFGFILGIPTAVLTEIVFHAWWLLPICGVVIGYTTNLLGIWMIFEPVEPRRFLGRTFQGLFLKRQPEVSDIYSRIIADDIVTLNNIGEELMHGPRADRTRKMIEDAMHPAVDRAAGRARGVVRVAVGTQEYDAIRSSVAAETVDYAITPFQDEGSASSGAGGFASCSRSGCGRCRRATSRRCFAPCCARTSGSCTCTGPCWDSVPA